jgi:hypothetical protein
MFTPARYIAIDDSPDELSAIVDALHAIGAPCVGVQFDPPALPDRALFSGVRILLTDLHLLKGAANSLQHFDTLANLLNACVPDNHGPYLTVLWTSHEHERAAFAARLDELLPAEKRPIAVLALDKNKFRVTGGWNGAKLQGEIRQKITEIPQLHALLSWERDILAAANTTLSLVGGLVPAEQRTGQAYSPALDRVLSLLAETAAGAANARIDPRAAVSEALAPLLADRALNQPQDVGLAKLWREAVTFPAASAPLTQKQKAEMHRMLHFAFPPAEQVARTDWGAVTPLGDDQLDDAAMMSRYGVTAGHLRETEFKLKPERINEGRLVVVRGGAACDQAQCNAGPIPILLGLLVPTGALSKSKRSAAIHQCPEELLLKGGSETHALLVHARYATTLVADDFARWPESILRIREQLLMTILVHGATHIMRPGTLRF